MNGKKSFSKTQLITNCVNGCNEPPERLSRPVGDEFLPSSLPYTAEAAATVCAIRIVYGWSGLLIVAFHQGFSRYSL
jgi:hypothetical protein